MKFFLCFVGLLAACGTALGQPFEFNLQGAYYRFGKAQLGSYSAEQPRDDDTRIKLRNGAGARFTINTKGYYGHEFTYLVNKGDLTATTRAVVNRVTVATTQSSKITMRQGAYNFLMYMMPRGERWRPYITGGLQMTDYGRPSLAGIETFKTRNYGANFGLGLKLRIAPRVHLRIDGREYMGGKPYDLKFSDATRSGGTVRMQEASFGLGFSF
ncbi:MAG: hypothetical protein FJW20_18775 [Acidimicrobiia bacterium]|nr:hypothetical protein [Acidimicrobiia bacterium]